MILLLDAHTVLDQLGITGARRFVTGWRTSYFCEYCRLQVLARVLLMRCGRRLTPRKRRALRLFVSSERSPLAFLWLALRPLRRLAGRSETLGSERLLTRGVLWRRLVTLSAVTPGRTPRFLSHDASLPPEASGRGG